MKPFNSFCIETSKNGELPASEFEKVSQRTQQELKDLNANGLERRNSFSQFIPDLLEHQDLIQEKEPCFENSFLWNESCSKGIINSRPSIENNNQDSKTGYDNGSFVKTEVQKSSFLSEYPENAIDSCVEVNSLLDQNSFSPGNEWVENQGSAYSNINKSSSVGYSNQFCTAPPTYFQGSMTENFEEKNQLSSQVNADLDQKGLCGYSTSDSLPSHELNLHDLSQNPSQSSLQVQKFSGHDLYPNGIHSYSSGLTENGRCFGNPQDNPAIKFHIRTITHCEVECPAPGKLPLSHQPWQEFTNDGDKESCQKRLNENQGSLTNYKKPGHDTYVNSFRSNGECFCFYFFLQNFILYKITIIVEVYCTLDKNLTMYYSAFSIIPSGWVATFKKYERISKKTN